VGLLVSWAIPRATKAALRSSLKVRAWIPGWFTKASVSGAQREPGHNTAWVRPWRLHNSAMSYIGWYLFKIQRFKVFKNSKDSKIQNIQEFNIHQMFPLFESLNILNL
jgi:hypothetical protein